MESGSEGAGTMGPATRRGAVLGAMAGAPIYVLLLQPPIAAMLERNAGSATAAPIALALVFLSWGATMVGLPLLGAAAGARGLPGREAARRLATGCILAAGAGGVVLALLLRVVPAMKDAGAGALARAACLEFALLVGVLLSSRAGAAPPPADRSRQ